MIEFKEGVKNDYMLQEKIFILVPMTLLAIFGLNYSWKQEGNFQKTITSGFVVAILIIWLGGGSLVSLISFLLTLGFALSTIFYGIKVKQLTKLERFSIVSLGFFLSFVSISKMQHLPFVNPLRASLIIPIVLFVILNIKTKKKQNKEFGFSLIMVGHLILEFSKIITY